MGGCPPKLFQAGQGRERNPAQGPGWPNEPVQGPSCLLCSRAPGSEGFWGPWDPTQASESTAIRLASEGERECAEKRRPGAPRNHPLSTRTSSPSGPSGRMGWWTGSRADAAEARPPGSSPPPGGTQALRSPSVPRRLRLALTHLCAHQVGPLRQDSGASPHTQGQGQEGAGGGNAPHPPCPGGGSTAFPSPTPAWGPRESWQGPCTVIGAGRRLPARTGGTQGVGSGHRVLTCAEHFVCK